MFDPGAIEAFRRHVEGRTITIIATYSLIGLAFGFIGVIAAFGRQLDWTTLLCGVGAGLGYVLGCERAFMLRLQAQMTLFQAHIEANTEPATAFDAAPTRVNPPPRSLLVKAGLRGF